MNMKKIRMYAAALCAVALCACTESVENLVPEVNDDVLVARIVDVDGRTQLGGDDMKSTFWSTGDALAVFRKNDYNCKFVLSAGNGTGNGTFKYAGQYFNGGEVESGIEKYYAVYPFAETIQINANKKISGVTFPAEQTYTEGSFDADAAFMTAIADGPDDEGKVSMNFIKAHTLLKVFLTPMPGDSYEVKSIKLESASKALSGAATLDMTTSEPVLVLGEAATDNKSLTLNCEEGVEVTAPVAEDEKIPFYIVVAPGTFSAEDLSITVTYADGKSETKKIGTEVTFARNQIVTINYPCGDEEIGGDIEEYTTSDENLNAE